MTYPHGGYGPPPSLIRSLKGAAQDEAVARALAWWLARRDMDADQIADLERELRFGPEEHASYPIDIQLPRCVACDVRADKCGCPEPKPARHNPMFDWPAPVRPREVSPELLARLRSWDWAGAREPARPRAKPAPEPRARKERPGTPGQGRLL